MRTLVILVGLGILVTSCASPRQMAERACTQQVANEMGYDVNPNGEWRQRPGTSHPPGTPIQGSGARVQRCMQAQGY